MANITPSEIEFRLGLLIEGAKTLTAELDRVAHVCAKIAACREAELAAKQKQADNKDS